MADEKLTQLTGAGAFADTDLMYIVQNVATTPVSRKTAWSLVKSTLKTYFDTLYASIAASDAFPLSVVDGLTLSNNVTDANNDIDIATGKAVDSGGTDNMTLSSALTKRLDANWVVGTNQGGLDTGSKLTSTWYHVFLIKRTDTGVVDVLFSSSFASPTMPTNYTKKRRIGSVKTDSSGNIIQFLQYGDDFWWKSPPALDVNVTNLGTTRTNYTLASVPTGLVVEVRVNVFITGGSTVRLYVSNPNLTDLAPSDSATPLHDNYEPAGALTSHRAQYLTNTSAQISARTDAANSTFRVAVLGWEDPRGKW